MSIRTLVVAALVILLPHISAAQNQAAAENYLQADANGDGMLVYAEFASFIDLNAADGLGNAERVSARGLHARAFNQIDSNGDGVVTPQELQATQ